MLTGNREYNEIYEKYKNLVLKIAYTYSGNNYDAAEDIAQDTFLKLYIGFDELKNGNIYAWLYTTTRNAAFNHYKKYRREIPSEDEVLEREIRIQESVEEEYAEKSLEVKRFELHERIFRGLMEKNPRWHEAIVLTYYMNIPQAKVAEMMGIRVEVLHSMLHRARKWIAKTYGAEYEEMKQLD